MEVRSGKKKGTGKKIEKAPGREKDSSDNINYSKPTNNYYFYFHSVRRKLSLPPAQPSFKNQHSFIVNQ